MTLFSDQERAILDAPLFAKLATLGADGTPQLTVMWFRRVDDELRMIAPASAMKTRHLTRYPRCALLIDADGYTYLELRGAAEIRRDDAAARAELRQIAARYIGARAEAYVAGLSADPRVIIALRPQRVRAHIRPEP